MNQRSILAVPGLASTSPAFRASLWELAARNAWDVDALAAVISSESGFNPAARNTQPGQTASGLIQMIDSTARDLGIAGGAAAVRGMSALQQLPWVEKYFRRAFGSRAVRPVDFYLALWGSGVGADESRVLASSGERNYDLNAALDVDGDGAITVGDIRAQLERQQARARGARLDASPVGFTPAAAVMGALLALVAVYFRRL